MSAASTPGAEVAPGARNKPVADMTTAELAKAISNRLRRLEADEEWNRYVWTDRLGQEHKQSHLYGSHAAAVPGNKVRVVYVSYQGSATLERGQAEDYLTWLRAGNRGQHFTASQRGAIRRSRRATEADDYERAYAVEYSEPVWRSVHVPEAAPAVFRAEEVREGDRVYVSGGWRKVQRADYYAPPMPEDVQGLVEEVRAATLRGEYRKAQHLARDLELKSKQMADGRELEVHLKLAGGRQAWFTPEALVGVKRARS